MYNNYFWGISRIFPRSNLSPIYFWNRWGGGGVPLTAYNAYFRCSHEKSLTPFNHLIKKLILLKLETKTYSTTWLGWSVAPWHPLAPFFKSISEKIGCQWVPGARPPLPFFPNYSLLTSRCGEKCSPSFIVPFFTLQSPTPFLSLLALHFLK